jgi:hypothetical protein
MQQSSEVLNEPHDEQRAHVVSAKVTFACVSAGRSANLGFEQLSSFLPGGATSPGLSSFKLCCEGQYFRVDEPLSYDGHRCGDRSELCASFSCNSDTHMLSGRIHLVKDASREAVDLTLTHLVMRQLAHVTSLLNLLKPVDRDLAERDESAVALTGVAVVQGHDETAVASEDTTDATTGDAGSSTPDNTSPAKTSSSSSETGGLAGSTLSSSENSEKKLQPKADVAAVESLAVVVESSCKEKQLGSGDAAADSEKQDAVVNTTSLDQALVTVSQESFGAGATGVSLQQRELLSTSAVSVGSVKSASATSDTGNVSSAAMGTACDSSSGVSSSSSSNASSTPAGSITSAAAAVHTAAAGVEGSPEAAGQPLTLKRKASEGTTAAAAAVDGDEAEDAAPCAEVSAHKRQRQVPVQNGSAQEPQNGSSSNSSGNSSSGDAVEATSATSVHSSSAAELAPSPVATSGGTVGKSSQGDVPVKKPVPALHDTAAAEVDQQAVVAGAVASNAVPAAQEHAVAGAAAGVPGLSTAAAAAAAAGAQRKKPHFRPRAPVKKGVHIRAATTAAAAAAVVAGAVAEVVEVAAVAADRDGALATSDAPRGVAAPSAALPAAGDSPDTPAAPAVPAVPAVPAAAVGAVGRAVRSRPPFRPKAPSKEAQRAKAAARAHAEAVAKAAELAGPESAARDRASAGVAALLRLLHKAVPSVVAAGATDVDANTLGDVCGAADVQNGTVESLSAAITDAANVLYNRCPQYSTSADADAAADVTAGNTAAVAARHTYHISTLAVLQRVYSTLKIELHEARTVDDCKGLDTVLDEVLGAAQPAVRTDEQLQLEEDLQALLQLLHIALPAAIPADATVMDGGMLGSALAAAEPEFFDALLSVVLSEAAMLAATVTERHTGAAAATIATAADADDEEASAAAVELQRAECLRVCKCLHACCTQLRSELTLARLITVAAPPAKPVQPGLPRITRAHQKLVTRFLVGASEAAQKEPSWQLDSDYEEYDFAPICSVDSSVRRRAAKQPHFADVRERLEHQEYLNEHINAHYVFHAMIGRPSVLGNRLRSRGA